MGPMHKCTQQAYIDAPLDLVWDLAADRDRQTEWWPDTVTFECIDGTFEQGCKIRNVNTRPWPMGDLETTVEVAKMDPGHELFIRCTDTGTYTRAVLTEGGGGTFVQMEAGNDPDALEHKLAFGDRAALALVGDRLFRRWVDHALDALRSAAEGAKAPA